VTDIPCSSVLTVAQVYGYWLENRRDEVKKNTWRGYRQYSVYILGPLLVGTRTERVRFSRRDKKPENAQFVEMLGAVPISELTTARIRAWHKTLTVMVSPHTANVAKKFLRAALALAAEDQRVSSVPHMPTRLGRGKPRPRKHILLPEQVGLLLTQARHDERSLYCAFPFLTGVRPSEQLALWWDDIDFDRGLIRIRRMQELDRTITNFTKTAASMRDVPMSKALADLMAKWRLRCPAGRDGVERVFPCLGFPGSRYHKKRGDTLSYANFIRTYWRPVLKALGLPIVTPHSARHVFISTLQSLGIEVGLVAKLAGHADVAVTLSHYTQAVRGGQAAVESLEEAYWTVSHCRNTAVLAELT
jgi:integrase